MLEMFLADDATESDHHDRPRIGRSAEEESLPSFIKDEGDERAVRSRCGPYCAADGTTRTQAMGHAGAVISGGQGRCGRQDRCMESPAKRSRPRPARLDYHGAGRGIKG